MLGPHYTSHTVNRQKTILHASLNLTIFKSVTMILHLMLLIFFGELKVDAEPLFFKGLQNVWKGSQVLIYKTGRFHAEGRPELPDCVGFVLKQRDEYENMTLD